MSRNYPDWLVAYTQFAQHSEAPTKMHFWSGVSAIAGALRRRVWFNMGHFNWYPNFYIILVAPPGIVAKSTTIDISMDILRQVEDIKFGPSSLTWQALLEAMQAAGQQVRTPTGFAAMSCMTVVARELGTLFNPKDGEFVDVLIDLWDGKDGTWKRSTKTAGEVEIQNPWINIIAATTPSWIADNFAENIIMGGLTSRIVFVYAEHKRQMVAYPHLHMITQDPNMQKKLKEDLEKISNLNGKMDLTDEAYDWGKDWYDRHWATTRNELTSTRFGGYIARKQTHMHKLGMVLSASQGDSLRITKDNLIFAEAMLNSLEADMPKIFREIGKTTITRAMDEVYNIVTKQKRVTQSGLYRAVSGQLSAREFQEVLGSLVVARKITLHGTGNTMYIQMAAETKNDSND